MTSNVYLVDIKMNCFEQNALKVIMWDLSHFGCDVCLSIAMEGYEYFLKLFVYE